jgi:peptidoglycan/LPS O-acetylase OafA/YrhL
MHPSKDKEYFHSLTSLRGIAALWVALGHISWTLPATYLVMFLPIIRKGYLAVDFFFILSGFVLAHAYKIHTIGNWSDYARFCRARIARIFPIHILFLLIFSLIYFLFLRDGLVLPGVYEVKALVAEFFLVHTLPFFNPSYFFAWNYPSWTLVIEVWWFIALVGIIAAWNRFKPDWARALWLRNRKTFLALGVGSLLVSASILAINKSSAFVDVPEFYNSLLRSGVEFIAGLFLYQAFAIKEFHLGRVGRYILYFGLLLGIFVWSLPLSNYIFIAYWLMLLPFLVMGSLDKKTALYKVLMHPALIYLGNISYSLYLIHGIVERVIAGLWPKMEHTPRNTIFMYFIFISGTFVLSALSYKYVEKTFIAYFKPKARVS